MNKILTYSEICTQYSKNEISQDDFKMALIRKGESQEFASNFVNWVKSQYDKNSEGLI